MNLKQVKYTGAVGKIDNLLSYTGGLFSIVIAFLSLFLKSFNEYRYELKIAEGAFNMDKDGKKIKESDMTFFCYIKFTIHDWIQTLFCVRL